MIVFELKIKVSVLFDFDTEYKAEKNSVVHQAKFVKFYHFNYFKYTNMINLYLDERFNKNKVLIVSFFL